MITIQEASEKFKITKQALYRRLAKYGLEPTKIGIKSYLTTEQVEKLRQPVKQPRKTTVNQGNVENQTVLVTRYRSKLSSSNSRFSSSRNKTKTTKL